MQRMTTGLLIAAGVLGVIGLARSKGASELVWAVLLIVWALLWPVWG